MDNFNYTCGYGGKNYVPKRRKIQKTKVVSDAYLEGLLGKEMFADRLIRRLARGNTLGEKGLK